METLSIYSHELATVVPSPRIFTVVGLDQLQSEINRPCEELDTDVTKEYSNTF